MADAPWRCSQCGTINEPVANACRTCGRWPSLFDLEESKVDEIVLENAREEPWPAPPIEAASEMEAKPVEVPTFEDPDTFETETFEEVDAEPPQSRWRNLAGAIVPLLVLLYIVVSAVVGNR